MLRANDKIQSVAQRKAFTGRTAFTLVEIILAIAVASVLLLVALTFYQQAADMRGRILRESDQFSTVRLTLDRLAGDLRTAQPQARAGNEFTGDGTSMHFIKMANPGLQSSANPGAGNPTDLLRISIATVTVTNGTNIEMIGLDRLEDSIIPAAPASSLSNSLTLALDLSDQTNRVTEPFADMVRFVRFRYWDGAAWQAGWTNASPPPGVEILLSTTGLASDAGPDDYPPDLFRRVVFLPGGVPHPASDSGFSTDSAGR